jgi:crotonobetainyl-CoA:carnitine CoA-transferase CaiB-like acyl-CoA transferase
MKDENNSIFPLRGIKVLDLTRLIPGAFCTSILGDVGAEVIKVEEIKVGDYARQIHPFIGPMASRFLILNRNKKSVALNLKDDEGREIFLKMVREADVLVEGFRPGTMKKLRLDYESLNKENPRLIFCSIASFGQSGPYRDVVAHDINILGIAGFLEISGERDGKPMIPGVQISDSIAGMNAALAILIALIGREKTDRGQFLDISMFDGMMSWIFDAARYVFAGKSVPDKGKGRLWGGLPNYNLYRTKDGKYITVGALETKFKRALLKKLGHEDLMGKESGATSTETRDDEGELFAFLQKTFLTKTRDEWMDELAGLNICVGPVNTIEEALSHPQTLFRAMVVEVDHPGAGKTKQLGSPLKFSEKPIDVNRFPAPQLGEHTREILGRFGYSEQEVEALLKRKIAGGIDKAK